LSDVAVGTNFTLEFIAYNTDIETLKTLSIQSSDETLIASNDAINLN